MIFLISFVSATQKTLPPVKLNEVINLTQTCSNCTFNNITGVMTPNSERLLANVQMTKDGTFYNYTFSNTSVVGEYVVNGIGDLDGNIQVWNYNFFVTKTGKILTTGNAISYFWISIASILIFIFTLWWGIVMPYEDIYTTEGKIDKINKLKNLKVVLFWIAYIDLIWILNILVEISNNFLLSDISFKFFSLTFKILLYSLFVVIPIGFMIMVKNMINDFKNTKAMERGQ